MLIGYALVSTNDQETARQLAASKAVGRERIFREKASGGRWTGLNCNGFSINSGRASDVLVVWKLDRSRVPFKTFSRSWNGSEKPGLDSAA